MNHIPAAANAPRTSFVVEPEFEDVVNDVPVSDFSVYFVPSVVKHCEFQSHPALTT
jgi:hypothetical protein